jgi:hypothetical protein
MNREPSVENRQGTDPRQAPTSILDSLLGEGERMRNRRAVDLRGQYFVDRFPFTTMLSIMVLLAFTVLDGVLTLDLVELNCRELNPFMGHLLKKGPLVFLLGKYVLTAAGLPVLLVFKNHCLFGTRFRVGYLVPCFVSLYACLIVYQIQLVQQLK